MVKTKCLFPKIKTATLTNSFEPCTKGLSTIKQERNERYIE